MVICDYNKMNPRFCKGLTNDRRLIFFDLLKRTREHLGFSIDAPAKALEVAAVVSSAGGEGPDSVEIESKGFDLLDFRMLCLRTHYRKPLEFSWAALEEARVEREGLKNFARVLQKRGYPAANRTGLHAYKKRFIDSLADDFNSAAALEILWDCLRPGALSMGSQMGMLEAAEPILGIQFLQQIIE